MAHPFVHAQSSVRRFGGSVDDYLRLHEWFDQSKELFADFRHRALRHHSHGIFELERVFGVTITNSDGRDIPVRMIGEQHVREDCDGRIPTVADWLSEIRPLRWMLKGSDVKLAAFDAAHDAEKDDVTNQTSLETRA